MQKTGGTQFTVAADSLLRPQEDSDADAPWLGFVTGVETPDTLVDDAAIDTWDEGILGTQPPQLGPSFRSRSALDVGPHIAFIRVD